MKNPSSVIKKLQLTEKATELSEGQNKYFFAVDQKANKLEIKQAIEDLFGVQVASVNTMRYVGKRKRERTMQYGRRADWKRAVVTLKEGSRIDLA
jgi:large subunit ribosomal protein L23